MNILITGGAGYIGSHTIRALLSDRPNYQLTVVDNFSTGHLAALPKDIDFHHMDIQDTKALESLLKKKNIQAVIHFAASSLVGESMEKPLVYYQNNLQGTLCLLEAMVNCNVKHLVFSSTAAVYGSPTVYPITEDSQTLPENTYGATKLAMEQMIHWTGKAHNLTHVALRYFNAAGAHPSGDIGEAHYPETHLIPLVLQVASGKREHISIFGDDYTTKDGTAIRDYIHVMDLAQAHILALDYLAQGGESLSLNLGNGVGFTVKEVIDTARLVTGHPIPANIAPRRMGDPPILLASSQKAMSTLSWKPQHANLEEIIADAWRWHSNEKF